MIPRSIVLLGLISVIRVSGQTTNVTCDPSFDWANNSKGQSPCLVAAYLQAQCFPNKKWNVPVLSPGQQYLAPAGTVSGCACSSPVYSLLSACAACQGNTYLTWRDWTATCSPAFVNNGSFPWAIPQDTDVPHWAMKVIDVDASFDLDAAQGKESNSLSGVVMFLVVFLPILLLGVLAFGGWVWWRRRQTRGRSGSSTGTEPLLRRYGGSRISVDTTSDVHIHLTHSAGSSVNPHHDRRFSQQPSPVPTTPDYTPHSANTASPSSPGHQYAMYPETQAYHAHQPYLAPPSAATTGFPVSYHTPNPSHSQTQPPHTGATTNTFGSQQDRSRINPNPEPENDSGTFPRTPVEPQLRSLPLGDPRNLLPPSVRANAPETST